MMQYMIQDFDMTNSFEKYRARSIHCAKKGEHF